MYYCFFSSWIPVVCKVNLRHLRRMSLAIERLFNSELWSIYVLRMKKTKNTSQLQKDSLRIKSDSNKAMSWRKMETTHQGCLGSFLHFITPSTSKRNSCLSKRNQKKETNINHSIGEVKTKEQECNSLNAKMVGNKKK